MLESAEIGHRVPKQTYAREERKLRAALLNAQYDLSQSGRGPVLLIISGVEAGGRGETANKLTEWMDPRHIHVVAFAESSPEESAHPEAWRYWHALPPRGKLGIFLNAWYHESVDHLRGNRQLSGDEGLHARLEAIREHEQMLTDEGVVLLKFWIHLSKAAQKILLGMLQATLAKKRAAPTHAITPTTPSVVDNVKLIRDLDLSQRLAAKDYERALEKQQGRVARLTRHKRFARHSLVLVFEGVDAAGKGGAV